MDNKKDGKVTQSERQHEQITTSKCSLQTIDVNIDHSTCIITKDSAQSDWLSSILIP